MIRCLLLGKHWFAFSFFILLGLFLQQNILAQNDNCSGAINISVGQLACTYVTQSNTGATNSTDPAPGCAGYNGKDVWFRFTVPASGNVTVDMTEGTLSDVGMALYSGACGSLSLLGCDDNSSNNGFMPLISQTGLTAGATIYIRIWDFGGDQSGTFGICVQDNNPPSTCGQICSTAAPSNDNCVGAYSLGTLPSPLSCQLGGGNGALVSVPATVTNNVCATPSNPYTAITSCSGGGAQANPAADVWYSFTATATDLVISITGGLQSPTAALYTGTCSNLTGFGCAIGTGGTLNQTFSPLTPGATYYLQISGGTPNDRCGFTLSVRNNRNCNYCIQQSSLVVNPQPGTGGAPPGAFLPGTTVQFCYTISQYNTTAAVNVNWLHGVVPLLGSGWDASTLAPVLPAPPPCATAGQWGWYQSVDGVSTCTGCGIVAGPGFFHDAASGGGGLDGNPGNNWGDPGTAGCAWTFCWTVETKDNTDCVPSDDLNMTVAVYADSQTGSWTQPGCQQDPDYPFFAENNCCDLTISVGGGGLACPGTGIPVYFDFNDPLYPNGPWSLTYVRNGSSPITVNNITSSPYSITVTQAGTYSVASGNNLSCIAGGTGSASVNFAPTPQAIVSGGGTVCAGVATPNVTITLTGIGPWTVTYLNSLSGTSTTVTTSTPSIVLTAPPAGTYSVTSVASNAAGLNCTGVPVGSATVTVINIPVANAGTDQTVCGLSTNLSSNSVTAPVTGTWSIISTPPGGTASFSPNANSPNPTLTATLQGNYTVRWTTAQGTCTSTDDVVIGFTNIVANAGPDQTSVCGLSTPLAATAPGAGMTGQWVQTAGTGTTTFSNATSASSTATASAPGVYTYQWQLSNGTCNATDLVTVTFIGLIAAAGADQSAICGLTGSLAGNAPAGGASGTWTLVSPASGATFGNATQNNSSVTVTSVGTYTFQWTINDTGCSANDQVVLTFTQANANAGTDQNSVCGNTATLAGNAQTAPFVGTWTQTGGTGTSSFAPNANAPNATVAVTLPGSYTFQWTSASGACAASDAVGITFIQLPSATLSGGGAVCGGGGSSVPIQIALTGPAPFTFTYNINGTPTTVNAFAGPSPYTINATQAGTYTVSSVSNASGCTSTGTGSVIVTTQALPTASISGTTAICGAQQANLTFTLTGNGPFDVVYTDGTSDFTLNNITTGATVPVSPTSNTTYTIVSVADNSATPCTNTGTGSAVISVSPPPQANFSTLQETCNGTNTAYQVSFQITGGSGTYNVTPAGGILVGNLYTSAFIPSGTAYNFTINDSAGCGPTTISGTFNCACTTEAGDMLPTPSTFCENASAQGLFTAGTETLDADDTGMFALHTNAGASLGTVLASSASNSFTFNAATMSYGTTYYISHVVGNATSPGVVNTNDPCLSVSPGTPIVFVELPDAQAGTVTPVCALSTVLNANQPNAPAIGTWTYTGPGNLTFSNANDPQATITADLYGSYTLTWSVTNPPCSPSTSTVTVIFRESPSISLSNGSCNANYTAYNANIAITGGTTPYTVTASSGTVSGAGNSFAITGMPESSSVTVDASTPDGCSNTFTISTPACDCPFIAQPAGLSNITYCGGNTTPTFTATNPGAGLTVIWFDAPTGGNQLASGLSYTPPAGTDTYYALVQETVSGCQSQPVAVTLTEIPELTITADQLACSPDLDSYSVGFTLSGGTAPYVVNITGGTLSQIGAGAYTITGIPEGTNISISVADNSGTLTNTGNCSETLNITSPFCFCPVLAPPTVNTVPFCFGAPPAAITAIVDIGFEVAWYTTATGGTAISTSNPFNPSTTGTYFVETVDPITGCESSTRTQVNIASSTQITVTQGSSTCSSDISNYDLNIQISGGVAPYTATEANGLQVTGVGNNLVINNIPNNTPANLNITDAAGCQISWLSTPVQCSCPAIPAPQTNSNGYCAGSAPVPLSVTNPGGVYTALWYNVGTGGSSLFEGLSYTPPSAGTYFVEIQDTVNNCSGVRVPITLTEHPALVLNENVGICSADLLSYSIPFTLSGGAQPYTVNVSSGTLSGNNGNYNVSGIPINVTVSVTAIDDNNCSLPATLLTPATCPCPSIPVPIPAATTATFCVGNLPPSISVADPGAAYSVFWYDAPTGGNVVDAGLSITPPQAGTYYVGLSLAISPSCQGTRATITVTENTAPQITQGVPSCAADLLTYQTSVTALGSAPFNASVSNPASVTNVGGGIFTIQGIPSNTTATVTITDTNGCQSTATVGPQDCDCPVINPPSNPQNNTYCAGETETALTVDAAPAGFQISWYAAATGGVPLQVNSNTFTPNGLGAGTYYAEVRDPASGCSSIRIPVVLTEGTLNPPTINGIAPQYCSNAAPVVLSATPSGGSFTVNGQVSTTLNPSNLPTGIVIIAYTYNDINGCPQENTANTSIAAPLSTPVVNCNSATPTSVGFAWNDVGANVYTVIVSIDGGASISQEVFTENYLASGLQAGAQVTVIVVANGLSICGDSAPSDPVSCFSLDCSPLTPTITGLDASYCSDDAPDAPTLTPIGGVFSGPGVTGTTFNPAQAGTGNITLTYNYEDVATGCSYSATTSTNVVAALTAPVVTCAGSTTNSVSFSWTNLGVTQYNLSISVNGAAPSNQSVATNSFTQNGLSVGDDVTLIVTAVGAAPCGNSPASVAVTCTAQDCPSNISPSINGLPTDMCANDAAIVLQGTPVGGIFSGTGVANGQLDPAAVGVANTTVVYTYTDPATNCVYTDQQTVNIETPLPAPIPVCSNQSTNDVTFSWNNVGTASYDLLISINNGAPSAQNGVVGTSYNVSNLQAGDEVSIIVIANGTGLCGDSPPSAEVTCTALDCPPINPVINIDALYCATTPTFALSAVPSGGTFSGIGVNNGNFDPSSVPTGTPLTISYEYQDAATNCVYPATADTWVDAPLASPVVVCAGSTVNSVTFDWADVPNADAYQITISINGGAPDIQNVLPSTYMQTGLSVNDAVTITVIATGSGACGNSAPDTETCTAQNCDPLVVSIDNLAADYCANDAAVVLQGTPVGGTFSGNGVVGNTFDPADVAGNTANITYTYTDLATQCDYTIGAAANIVQPLAAPVVNCVDTEIDYVSFTWTNAGVANYIVSISINNGVATTSNVASTLFTQDNLQPGDDVTIIVIAESGSICGNSAPSVAQTCSASSCQPIATTIDNLAAEYCTSDPSMLLTATPAGGTFSGDGINNGTFDPSLATPNTPITITYNYVEAGTNCPGVATANTLVSEPLPAPVVQCGTSTTNSVTFTWNDIANIYTAQISINGVAQPDATLANPVYIATGLTIGDNVTIIVTAEGSGACANSAPSLAVTCTAANCPTDILPTIGNLASTYCETDASFILQGLPVGGTFSGDGVANGAFTPNDAGPGVASITYLHTDPASGCNYDTTYTTTVVAELSAPIVSCGTSSTNSVTFDWSDAGVAQYSITYSIDGGAPISEIVNDNTHTVTGLSVGNNVSLSVIALGTAPCGDSPASTAQVCTAQNCPDINPVIDNLDSEYCVDAAAVILQGTPSGGTFSGDGVAAGVFSPSSVVGNTASIVYAYTDIASGCNYDTTYLVTIAQPLSAPEVSCGTSSTNTVSFNWTDVGVLSYEISISIDGGAVNTQTVNATTFTQSGLSVGNDVTITVVAIGTGVCGNSVPSAVQTCTAQDCPNNIDPTIDNLAATYCTSDNAVVLEATPAGGVFTGNGVNGGVFEPSVAGAGDFSVLYTYTDLASGCNYTENVAVSISEPLAAPVVSCDDSVEGSLTFSWADVGATQYEISVSINGGAAQTQTLSTTTYTENGLSPNDEVSISVSAIGTAPCGNSVAGTANCVAGGCPVLSAQLTAADTTLCTSDTAVLLTTQPVGGILSGLGITGNSFNPASAGAGTHELVYTYTENACTYTDTLTIQVTELSGSILGATTVPPNTDVTLSLTTNSTGSLDITWTDVLNTVLGEDVSNLTVTPEQTTTYLLDVVDAQGCSIQLSATINVIQVKEVLIPNSFSPNGDNNNDIFRIQGFNVANIETAVYNRWGQQVYYVNTGDINQGWDGYFNGHWCDVGVYVYTITVTRNDGTTEQYKGNLTLVR